LSSETLFMSYPQPPPHHLWLLLGQLTAQHLWHSAGLLPLALT